jgi:hypothetical protein
MSDVKAKAAICEEVCGGKLVFRNADNFECESCGMNYPKEWVKAKVQEITGTVKIEGRVEVTGKVQVDGDVGGDSADTLYNRAIDWLNLQDEKKAIEVLLTMTERYPGDVRSWGKLARLNLPGHIVIDRQAIFINKSEIIDNAVRLGDDSLMGELESIVQNACDEIRSGQGEEWVHEIFGIGFGRGFVINPLHDFSCARELFAEGQENAEEFNSLWQNKLGDLNISAKNFKFNRELWVASLRYSCALTAFWKASPVFANSNGYGEGIHHAVLIIGKFMFYRNANNGEYRNSLCKDILSKSYIQQTFNEIERRFKNKLCLKCSSKLSFWGKCPICDKTSTKQ